MKKLAAVTITALLAVLAAGATVSFGNASGTKVNVTLKEFKLLPSPKTAGAGRVLFVAKNVGKVRHEMVVIRTNLAPSKLPVTNGRASEKGTVGEIGDVDPGKTRSKTLVLKAGKYVLICNLKGHHQAGQYAGFTVN